jgi:hypothetical protein
MTGYSALLFRALDISPALGRRRDHRGRQSVVSRRACTIPILLIVFAFPGSSGSAAEEPRPAAKSKGTIVDDLSPLAPAMLDREGWKAEPAQPGMRAQKPVAIILHHTGVRQNPGVAFDAKLRGLQSYSQRPGHVSPTRTKPAWPDLPYHYYVDHAGRSAEGRDVGYAGDTNTRYDTANYIQVVVEGDFEQETPAPEQMTALRKILVWLMLAWNIPPEKITVHRDHAPTSCPGRNFMAVLPEMLAQVAADRDKAVSEICARSPSAQFSTAYCLAR